MPCDLVAIANAYLRADNTLILGNDAAIAAIIRVLQRTHQRVEITSKTAASISIQVDASTVTLNKDGLSVRSRYDDVDRIKAELEPTIKGLGIELGIRKTVDVIQKQFVGATEVGRLPNGNTRIVVNL